MDLTHAFPRPPADGSAQEAVPVDHAALVAGLTAIAALTPTGRAQARVDGVGSGGFAEAGLSAQAVFPSDRPRDPAWCEHGVHHGGLAAGQVPALDHDPSPNEPQSGPVRPRERP